MKISMMKNNILIFFLLICLTTTINAQVPNFAGTAGKDNIYGYFSFKVRPGINNQETYSTIQYGATNWMALGADYYTGANQRYLGLTARFGKLSFGKSLNIGAQFTPSFDLEDNFKWSYLTSALYLNGDITSDGKLFFVADTWYTINKGHSENSIDQWLYLAYNIPFKNGRSITPMVGTIYSWKFDRDPDLALGAYYSIGKCNLYLWGNDFFKDHPRVILGLEFKFGVGSKNTKE